VVTGDRTKACKGLEGSESSGETGNLGLQQGESYLSLLCIVFSQEDASQGQRSLQLSNGCRATIKHKRRLMIRCKEEDNLQWQLGHNFACILVLKGM